MGGPLPNLPPNIPPAPFNSHHATCVIDTSKGEFYQGINVNSVSLNPGSGSVVIEFRGPFGYRGGAFTVTCGGPYEGNFVPWAYNVVPSPTDPESETVSITFWAINPVDGVCSLALPQWIWFAALKPQDGFVPTQATI